MALREDLMVRMGLDKTRFQRGLKDAQKQGKSFAVGFMKAIGPLLGAAGLTGLANAAINLGSKISDLATQLRIGGEELQVLKLVAQDAGLEFSILERAIRNTNQRTQMAIDGNKTYAEALQRLNLNMAEFAALPTEQKIEALAKAYMESGESLEAYTDISQILGQRAGPAMLEVLQRLANEGFASIEQAARDAGQVMSEETAGKMDYVADRIARLKTGLTNTSAEVLAKVFPAFDILRQTTGFLSDVLARLIMNALNFGRAMGTVIGSVIKPGVTALNALIKVLHASRVAFEGNFTNAKKLAKEAVDQFLSVGDDIAAIPKKIGEAFEELADDTKRNFKNLTGDVLKRGAEIAKAYNDLFPGDSKETDTPKEQPKPPPGAALDGGEDTPTTIVRRPARGVTPAANEPALDPSITSTDDPAEQARILARRQELEAQRRDPFGANSFAKESLGRTDRFTNDMPSLGPSAIDRAFGDPSASAVDRAFTPPQAEGQAATEAGKAGKGDSQDTLNKDVAQIAKDISKLSDTVGQLDNALSS